MLRRFGRTLAGLILAGVLAIDAASASAQAIALIPGDVGAPMSGAAAELYRPPGGGPFPALVVLHGCNGVGPHDRRWAGLLAQWGYVALLIDSFRPRGLTEVCNRGRLVPPEARAADAFAAMRYLRTLPFVRADRIGLVGFSHGGWAVLKAVLADAPRPADLPPFAAAVAFYPACVSPGAPLQTDTLILIGEADDWTPAPRCVYWRDATPTGGHTLTLKTYPNALHAFDQLVPPHDFAGHHVGRDPAAAEDSAAQARAFLAARLMAP